MKAHPLSPSTLTEALPFCAPPTYAPATLSDLGITRQRLHEARKLEPLPDDAFPLEKNRRGRAYYCRACGSRRQQELRAKGKKAGNGGRRPDLAILPSSENEGAWRALARSRYRKPAPIPADATWCLRLVEGGKAKTLCSGSREACALALARYPLRGVDAHLRIEPEEVTHGREV